MHDKIQRFSLRKLSVGLASVAIGTCIFSTNAKTVKADVTSDQATQKADAQTATAQTQSNDVQNEKQQTSSAQNSVVEPQKNLLDDLGKQKASTQSDDQAEAKNQENRLVDKINYKLTNNSSTDNKEDLGQNKVASDETKQDSTTKSDVEKSIVSSSSTQQTNNRSNNHAEDNSQTQLQKINLTKSSKQFDQKALATNLTETQPNDDWGTDPTKYGLHKTVAGWTPLQQGKDFDAIAKESHTILTDGSGNALNKNISIEASQGYNISTEIQATIDKNDIKKGNRILLSNTVQLYKEGPHFSTDIDNSWGRNLLNITSDGVRIGHIIAGHNNSYDNNISSSEFNYMLVVDNTLSLAKDLKLDLKFSNNTHINEYEGQWNALKGLTPGKSATIKWIANDSDAYNFTVHVDEAKKTQPHHVSSSNGMVWNLGQDFRNGDIFIGSTHLNPEEPYTSQNYTLNKVFKLSRPKKADGVAIPNFKSKDFNLALTVNSFFPILSKDGVLMDDRPSGGSLDFMITGAKLADGLSVQQVTEAAKNQHFVYSISDDGQSMLVGFNFSTNYANLAKLAHKIPYSADQIINQEKNDIQNTRLATIDYPDQIEDILNYSANYVKSHNTEPFRQDFQLLGWPVDPSQPNIQTISDVTIGAKDLDSRTASLLPSGINVDTSIYRNINVKFVDDDNNDKVINTNTFQTSTGTDLTYNIKDATDKTFNSATDIVFPKNFVLATNQPTTVHYGVIQDTNPDIVIHVKHLVKIISGDADLDLYPEIKKALNGDARRTITITYPAGKQGNNPSTIVQSVHYIRSGKADFTNDTVDESSLTKWNPVASSAHGVTITNGETTFDAVKLPHINGYKVQLIRDKANPAMFMISFVAVPEQSQNNQSTSNKPQNVQSSQKTSQAKQKQPEPIQTRPADDKQVDQIIDHISYTLMHNDSTSDNADSFEPAQNDSDQLEAPSDSTQKDDAAKPQKVNAAKHKKHIAKKHVIKKRKKHAKKYHLKRRSRKHTKRAKKRIIKHRRTSKKFKKYSLKKHIKRV